MDNLTVSIISIATAIVGVAILAVIVSRKSNTAGVLTAAGNAFSTALGTALSPITGNAPSLGNSFSGNSFNASLY